MKLLLLVTGGRGGSDFFQGLLDNHSQILQFPGLFNNENIFNILSLKNPDDISNEFINTFPNFFNSKFSTSLSKRERHTNLGPKRNKCYKVSKKKFIKNFANICNKNKLTKLDILNNLHIAYDISKSKKKKGKKKIVFVHTHIVEFTKRFIEFMNVKDITIIHTMRNPLSAINSPVKNWLKFEGGKGFLPLSLYFQLDLAFNGIRDLAKLKKDFFIVQLEKLHWKHKKVMNDFCKIFKIKYEKSLEKTTFIGLQWWGDKISKNWISGVNKNFKISIDKNLFYDRDIKFFESLAEDIIKFYKYDFIFGNINKIYLNLLPLKCELLVWKNAIKHKKIKHILSIPYFYLKRILLINKFVIANKYLPYSIGSNSFRRIN